MKEIVVKYTEDFKLTGFGGDNAWQETACLELIPFESPSAYRTQAKILYSSKGLYFLFDCEDQKLTCTMTNDGDDIFNEDVVEVFLQPEEGAPLYLEYELSPLGVELPLLVSQNRSGKGYHGWLPWHYKEGRQVQRATHIRGGEKHPLAACSGWTAEIFVPFTLLFGLDNVPPVPGTRWRANFYRIDYDNPSATYWSWSQIQRLSFHELSTFGSLCFGS